MQDNGQPIDLWLDHELGIFYSVIDPADPLKPAAHIVCAEGVPTREDRSRMPHLSETVSRFGSSTQRWRIGRDPVRVLGFDLLELVQQPVEFQVTDDGCIQDVITIIMLMNFLFEFFVSG